MGRDRLEREARAASVHLETAEAREILEARLKELKQPSWDAFYAAVGFNRITVHKMLEPLIPEKDRSKATEKPQKAADDAVLVDDNVGIPLRPWPTAASPSGAMRSWATTRSQASPSTTRTVRSSRRRLCTPSGA
ncbi:MAG: hypothetical protein IPL96_13515 [Holophagaceae bacterium]|nr:hypothetical protein [Holophagaceae bacterium]